MSLPSPLPIVLVLASGRGERFVASGGRGSKLQALLAGQPVLAHTLAAVRASGLPWHVEDAGHPGMGDSIAAGVRATRDAGGWLILPGDLPLVRPDSLQRVAAALATHAAVLPMYQGRQGHPVGFGARTGLRCLEAAHGCAGRGGDGGAGAEDGEPRAGAGTGRSGHRHRYRHLARPGPGCAVGWPGSQAGPELSRRGGGPACAAGAPGRGRGCCGAAVRPACAWT